MFSDKILIASFFAAIVPIFVYLVLLRWLDRYEPEPWWAIAIVFIGGAFFSTFTSMYHNTFISILGSSFLSESGLEFFTAGMVAPVIEEINKGIVVLIAFHFLKDFDNTTDGIIYGATAGLGFAFIENIHYFTYAFQDSGVFAWADNVFTRGFFCAGLHALATSVTGAAFGMTQYYSRADRFLIRGGGLIMAMMIHSFWNSLLTIGSITQDVFFTLLPFMVIPLLFLFLMLMLQFSLYRESEIIVQELREESEKSPIPKEHITVMASAFRRSREKFFGGKINSKRYAALLTEIAFKRRQAKIAADHYKVKLIEELKSLRSDLKSLLQPVLKETANEKGSVLSVVFVLLIISTMMIFGFIWKENFKSQALKNFPATLIAQHYLENIAEWPEDFTGTSADFVLDDGEFSYDATSGDGYVEFYAKNLKSTLTLEMKKFSGLKWMVTEVKLRLPSREKPKKSRELIGKNPSSIFDSFISARAQHLTDSAQKMCGQLKKSSPDHPLSFRCDGLLLADEGKLDDAIALYRELNERYPDYANAYMWHADAAWSKGQMDIAKEKLSKAWEVAPQRKVAMELAYLALSNQDFKELDRWLYEVQWHRDEGADYHLLKGLYEEHNLHDKEARAHFEQAITEDPTLGEAYLELAEHLLREQNQGTHFWDAYRAFEKGMLFSKDSADDVLIQMVDILAQRHLFSTALYHLERWTPEYDNPALHGRLAALYALFLNREDLATQSLSRGKKIDEKQTQTAFEKMVTLMRSE